MSRRNSKRLSGTIRNGRVAIAMAAAGTLIGAGHFFGIGAAQAANTGDVFTISATDFSVGSNYTTTITPGNATTTDVQLVGPYTGGTTFTINASSLSFGTLNDIDTTDSLIISNGNATAGTIQLNTAANSLSGTASDLLWVATGGNLALQNSTGTNTLILAVTGNIHNAGNLSLAGPISITAGTTTSFTGNGTTTVGGSFAGTTGAVTINNAGGNVTFSGVNAYTGTTTITAGNLSISGSGTLGATIANLSLGTGTLNLGTTSQTVGAVSITGAATITNGNLTGTSYAASNSSGIATVSAVLLGSAGLTKSGAGNLSLAAANIYTGTTTLNAGEVDLGVAEIAGTSGPLGAQLANAAGSIVLGGGYLQASSVNTNDYSGRFSTAANQQYNIDTNGQSVIWATALNSVGGNLTKIGTGNLTLTVANSYTGTTVINAGNLAISGSATLGATTANLTVGAGLLNLGATSQTVGAVSITGAGTITNGNLTGTFYAASNTSGTATISANLLGTGSLTKSANGTLSLSGNNTYSGGTTDSSGTGLMVLTGNSAGSLGSITSGPLGTGPVQLNAGGIDWTVGTAVTLLNPITIGNGTAAATVAFGTYHGSSSGLTLLGNVSLNSGIGNTPVLQAISILYNCPLTFSGLISGVSGLSISASSSVNNVYFYGNNTYRGGTTIASGVVNLDVSSVGSVGSITSGPLGTGNITITGGTLTASTTGNVTLYNPVQFNNGNTGVSLGGYLAKNIVFQGPVTLGAGNTSLNNNGSGPTDIFNGVITGTNSTSAMVITSGNFNFSGANTFAGGLTAGGNASIILSGPSVGTVGSIISSPLGTGPVVLGSSTTGSLIDADTLTSGLVRTILNPVTIAGTTMQVANYQDGAMINIAAPVTLTATPAFTIRCGGNATVPQGFLQISGNITDGGHGYGITTATLCEANLILSGNNSYSGNTTITANQYAYGIIATSAHALGTGNVSVGAGAVLNYVATNDAQLAIGGNFSATGGNTTTTAHIGGAVGSTTTSAAINVVGNATATGNVTVYIYGISGVAPLSGNNTYTLIQGASGSSLNAGNYTVGDVFNNTNFTIGAIGNTSSTLFIPVISQTPLPNAYWKGGYNGLYKGESNTWSASNGSSQSGWVATSGGANQALVPGATTNVFFSNSNGNISTPPTATVLGTNMTINSLTVQDTTNGMRLNADGNTLTIAPASASDGITVNANVPASNIAANVNLGAAQTWTNNSANVLTVSGIVSGGNALSTAGTGTVLFSGINTYTGGTSVTGGTLSLTGFGTLGATTAALTLGGGTLDLGGGNQTVGAVSFTTAPASGNAVQNGNLTGASYAASNAIGNAMVTANLLGAARLTQSGAGVLTLAGNNTYAGNTTINAGMVEATNPAALPNYGTAAMVVIAAGGTVAVQTGNGITGWNAAQIDTLRTSAAWAGNTSALGIDTANGNFSYGSSITQAIALNKLGANVLTLAGANTYTGTTTLSAGEVNVGVADIPGTSGPLGNGGGIALAGGYLQYSNVNQTDYSGRFSTAANQQYNVDTNGQNVTWVTALTSSGGSLTKIGTGNLILAGANTYSGNTTVTAGILQFGNNTSGSDGSVTGNITNNTALAYNLYGNQTYAGAIGGTGRVTVSGNTTSVLTLAGNNTYSGGTTVNAGSLAVANTAGSAIGIGSVTVNSGGILGGSGTMAPTGTTGTLISIASGAQLAPSFGTGTTTATLSANVSSSSSTAAFNIAGGTTLNYNFAAPGTSDLLAVTGNVTLAAGNDTLTINQLTGFGSGNYTLISASNLTDNVGNWALPSSSQYVYAMVGNSTALMLDVTPNGPVTVVWSGNTSGSWNTFSGNWQSAGVYADSDLVVFDDSASGNFTVDLGGTTVNPGSVTVNNSINAYSIGNGTIGGNGTLTKNGNLTLTLTGNNTYSGGTTVNAGTLDVATATDGLLSGSNVTNYANLQFDGAQTLSAISGNGTTTVNGSLAVGNISQTSLVDNGAVTVNGTGTVATLSDTSGLGSAGNTTVGSTGSLTVTSFAQASLINNGTVQIIGNGTIGQLSGTGSLNIGNGSLANTVTLAATVTPGVLGGIKPTQGLVTIASGSTLDITNNALLLNYGGNGTSPLAAVANAVAYGAGKAGNASSNGAIISSTVNNSAAGKYAVGYADHTEISTVPTGNVEVAYTLAGDANLDGSVDILDYQQMAPHYDEAGTYDWSQGDFNHDGHVDILDYQAMAPNYDTKLTAGTLTGASLTEPIGSTLLSAAKPIGSAVAADAIMALNMTTAVPEPASLSLLLLGGLPLIAGRRRQTRKAV